MNTRAPRKYRLATWIWLAPYFVASIGLGPLNITTLPTRYIEWVIIGLLAAGVFAVWTEKLEAERLAAGLFPLFFLAIGYEVFRSTGIDPDYLFSALIFCIIYGITIIYAALFFREDTFVDIFYRFAVISAVVAVLAFGISTVLDTSILVNFRGGGGIGGHRLQGFLPEPSAWAPIVPALLILGRRRRSLFAVVLAILVVLLAQSPTVLMVTVIAIAGYLIVTTRWSGAKIPAVIAVGIVALLAGSFVTNSNGYDMQMSTNPTERFVGRLVVGVQAGFDGDQTGDARLQSTAVVINDLQESGRWAFGNGLNSASVDYGDDPAVTVRPNSLWVRTLYETGVVGLILLLSAMLVALVNMRNRPGLAAIFIPAFVAAMVNSAGGHQLYKLVFLGILLFTFGWVRTPEPTELTQRRLPSPSTYQASPR